MSEESYSSELTHLFVKVLKICLYHEVFWFELKLAKHILFGHLLIWRLIHDVIPHVFPNCKNLCSLFQIVFKFSWHASMDFYFFFLRYLLFLRKLLNICEWFVLYIYVFTVTHWYFNCYLWIYTQKCHPVKHLLRTNPCKELSCEDRGHNASQLQSSKLIQKSGRHKYEGP